MAKDPAFLFYPGDWMQGTMIMTRHQKGCYMDLIIAQFNNGPLSLETIKTILGQDQATWTVLSSKFKKDSEGNFYNERLATEIEKRKMFTESRKVNGSKGGRPKPLAKPYGSHMNNLPENKDCIEVSSKLEDDLSPLENGKCLEFTNITLHRDYDSARISGLWKAFCIQYETKFYSNRVEKVSHFRNWIKTQPVAKKSADQFQNSGPVLKRL